MNSFINLRILPELLSIGKVGVFVDMPKLNGFTLADQAGSRPYIYVYQAEDIINWTLDREGGEVIYKSLVLRDFHEVTNPETGLIDSIQAVYRHLWIGPEGFVWFQFFDFELNKITEPVRLNIKKIPFVVGELTHSLLQDVADYQIALLNMESADISYLIRSNFPFYVEQFDPRMELSAQRLRNSLITQNMAGADINPGEAAEASLAKTQNIDIGTQQGRRIPKDLEFPQFVHPSSEPVKASMEKQDQIKLDIRTLINLSITNLQPKMASAESKDRDNQGLESGLSIIGLELERTERLIAMFWAMWEGSSSNATVKYPKRYSLKTEEERRKEADSLLDKVGVIPSVTYKKWALKKAIAIQIGPDVSDEVLDNIFNEIDDADVIYSDTDDLAKDVEQGLIGLEDAANARGYPEGTVERAKEDHQDRIRRIAESQGQARGVPDLGGLGGASNDEKNNTETSGTVPQDNTRGEAQ